MDHNDDSIQPLTTPFVLSKFSASVSDSISLVMTKEKLCTCFKKYFWLVLFYVLRGNEAADPLSISNVKNSHDSVCYHFIAKTIS